MATQRNPDRGEKTRQRLVATATRLFAERGYEATPIDAVLSETELSRGALYHHFSSKESLFEAVLEQVEADIAAAIIDAVRGLSDPVESLRAGCAAWLEVARDPVVRQISLIDGPAVVGWQRWREIDARHGLGLLSGALRAIAETGRVRAELVDVLAQMLLAALIEVAMVIARADDQSAATRNGETAVDELLTGLLAAP